MTELYSYETTPGDKTTLKQGQSPQVWTALAFEGNDISLVADPRYGKVYKCEVPVGDLNPWVNPSSPAFAGTGAGQLTIRRGTEYGQWRWYGIAVKVPSFANVGNLNFLDIASLGYQTIEYDQVAFKLTNVGGTLHYAINQNSGQLTRNAAGNYPGTVHYTQPFLPVKYGEQREFVLGVKWTADNTGGVKVYSRLPAGAWSQVFEKLNVPTYAYGSTNFSSWSIAQLQSSTAHVLDKIGLYYGMSGGVKPTETVYESGLTRCSDLATAQSLFPA